MDRESRRIHEIKTIARANTEATTTRLSWAQQALWFIDQLEGGSAAYCIPICLQLRGRLDLRALSAAFDHLVQRHEVLRTVFAFGDGEPMQIIHAQGRFVLEVIELRDCPENDRREQVVRHQQEEAHQPFDLKAGPLFRGRLLRLQDEDHVLLLTVHHIISDGWSIGLMMKELGLAYSAYSVGHAPALAPLRIQYADYAVWQREGIESQRLRKQLQYWRNQLSDAAHLLDLPRDRDRPAVATCAGGKVPITIDAGLSAELRKFADRHGVTLFMTLYAGFAILLSRLTGRNDILIGAPVANRQRPELETVLGLFVNTVVLRVDAAGNQPIGEFLREVKRVTLDAYEHQDVPFEKVVEALQPQRALNYNPVFQVMLALQSTPRQPFCFHGIEVTSIPSVDDPAMFDLLLALEEGDGQIAGYFSYATDLFDASTIERWGTALLELLSGIVLRPMATVAELSMLSANERHQVVAAFNATEADYPRDRSVSELFEEQVRRSPNATALIHDQKTISYIQLNRKANQLARHLARLGIRAGEYVAVLMPRSCELIIAELAILKCGAVYVPVDPEMPLERQALLIRDCGARLVLTDASVDWRFATDSLCWVDCTAIADMLGGLSEENPEPRARGSSVAYVMYTSGSTGVPKGVIVPHRAISRLVVNAAYVQIGPADCVSNCSNPAFDASTFEVWGALLNGASILIVPASVVLDANQFANVLVRWRVTVLWLTVGLFTQHSSSLSSVFGQLRYLMTGGDVVDPEVVRRVMRTNPPERLINAYGPTECTTFASTYLIESIHDCLDTLPIGRPISNTQIYILDGETRPVPIGVPGELYIGGDGVACGYLNRPELTAERFIADPFSGQPDARLYRTGDLGRWRADGTLEYLGRNDQQVKIRGFRVEPGEIEAHLSRHPLVREAIVVVRQDAVGEKRLIAYVTARLDQASPDVLGPDLLRAHLHSRLPHYMIPGAFVVLDKLPLTPNGKVDKRALPVPELQDFVRQDFEPPMGRWEVLLAQIWGEVLRVDQIGRRDNFFELGGHSLLVLKAVFQINRALSASVTVADVYTNPTIAQLAYRIQTGTPVADELVDLSSEAALDDGIRVPHGCAAPFPKDTLLTGSTGFVGRFLLAQLLRDTESTIYCLTRGGSAAEGVSRVRDTLSRWQLWKKEFEQRIVAVPGDLSSPRLGLDDYSYERLARQVGSIFHCGVSMNHLETFAMARPANVGSATELLRFATHSRLKLINYISSLSVFNTLQGDPDRTVDECSSIDHEKHWASAGYAASKWVAEKIFMRANERGIPCNIFRLGLVWADTQLGRYDELQREYRLMKSCFLSGCGIENYRYVMVPTPVDYVARAVSFLGRARLDGGGIFHLSSSAQADGGLFERCSEITGIGLRLLPLYDWACEIKRLHFEGRPLPIVPLIEHAFAMDRLTFDEHERRFAGANMSIDCSRTERELRWAEIVAPRFDDNVLRVTLNGLLSMDSELRLLGTFDEYRMQGVN